MFRATLTLAALPLALAAQEPLSAFRQREARALLEHRLPCRGCHVIDGQGGHVGPSLDDVGTRRNASYIRAMIERPQHTVPGAAMPLTPMPAAMRDLIIQYIAARAPSGASPNASAASAASSASSAASAAHSTDGKTLYATWCAACHGPAGNGDGANAKYLPIKPAAHSNAARMTERADDSLYDTIAGGGTVMGRSAMMPAFGATLSDSDIRALVAHLRTLCRCAGPDWSRRAP